jgi:hypothetical protein
MPVSEQYPRTEQDFYCQGRRASEALKSPHIVGLFCPYSRSLLTLVWSRAKADATEAPDPHMTPVSSSSYDTPAPQVDVLPRLPLPDIDPDTATTFVEEVMVSIDPQVPKP